VSCPHGQPFGDCLACALVRERCDTGSKHSTRAAELYATIATLRLRAESAEAALAEVMGGDGPWPLLDVLRRMTSAVQHGLQTHSCDHHGHEGDRDAMRSAIATADRIAAAARKLAKGGA
jgi:hypothetical protein